MHHAPALWSTPEAHLRLTTPDRAQMYIAPSVLQATARRFVAGFPGLVTYAVKANARDEVLTNLVAAGLKAFDVASVDEMRLVRRICPSATLHYNNPVRSRAEIAEAIALGVQSWSVDDQGELAKLAPVPEGSEIAVRLALPVKGAAYDFGAKFGATPDAAIDLLKTVAASGRVPALCFHPGTQCTDPGAWTAYIAEAARIAEAAGVRLARLNVGGGFPSSRGADATGPALETIFDVIGTATGRAFGDDAPELVCEPGRGMVGEAFTLAARIKAMKHDGQTVFLNDGLYGGLSECRDIGLNLRVRVLSPDGTPRRAPTSPRVVFGPTCDSLDRLPDGLPLPSDAAEDDYVLFDGMGAYSIAIGTQFNGYGIGDVVTVAELT
ncbi:type III PLP-dependent enzyme [Chachezhania sediminis]|uniref:type III PLP-dependent enzyme n=1 Tax=Chachezhania sediminis TaxID=2599291 RepID=UPI00131DA689|nr:type III PLP-dependent enzyme [Chachezhania sediminis]